MSYAIVDVVGDPTAPFSPPPVALTGMESDDTSLSELLRSQLLLAKRLQEKLLSNDMAALSPREMKELVSSLSTLLTLAHRTGQAEEEIQTYKTYVSIVNDFLKRRSDGLGEDLAAELRKVALDYKEAPSTLLP